VKPHLRKRLEEEAAKHGKTYVDPRAKGEPTEGNKTPPTITDYEMMDRDRKVPPDSGWRRP
jgi:hypothetical protein